MLFGSGRKRALTSVRWPTSAPWKKMLLVALDDRSARMLALAESLEIKATRAGAS